jgi:predicted amidophosphoribosyltransferase
VANLANLSDRAAAYLIPPRHGSGVCSDCLNLTRGHERCFACAAGTRKLAVVVPISYSVAGEPLHSLLASYKRQADPSVPAATAELAAILWRFLERHERCVAAAAGADSFGVVTTVPSGDRARHEHHPLRRIVGELAGPTRERHEDLLLRTDAPLTPRRFDPARYAATRQLAGASVLLIDDTWTSGASAQSAAAALLQAGARTVAAVVIGRHLNPGWGENLRRLGVLRGSFDFGSCALCAPSGRAQVAA